eukprot:1464714-Alexandrium_andersonii.AAC.1
MPEAIVHVRAAEHPGHLWRDSPDANIPRVSKLKRRNWRHNEWSFSSYSSCSCYRRRRYQYHLRAQREQ